MPDARAVEHRRPPRLFRGWWIVLTCYLAQAIGGGVRTYVFSVLVGPMGEGLGWSRSQIVGGLAIASVSGGLLSAPLGPFIDRYGPRKLMTGSLLLGGAVVILIGRVDAVWQYYALWAVFGLASPGFAQLGPVVAIANWFVRRRALAFMLVTFGSATSGIVLAPVIERVTREFDWRAGWTVMGLLLAALAPIAWTTVRRRPEDVGALPDGDTVPRSAAAGHLAATERSPWSVREALHTRAFWLLTVGFMLVSLPATSLIIHMSAYVVQKGYSPEGGAQVVGVYGAGVLLGRPVWGTLLSKAGIHRGLVVYGVSYSTVIVAFMLPNDLNTISATAALLGIAVAGHQQLHSQSLPDYFGRDIVGALAGYSTLAQTASLAAGPLYAALLFDATGSYTIPFLSFAAAALGGAIAFAFAPPPVHPSKVELVPQ